MHTGVEALVRKIPLFQSLDRRHQETIARTVFERSFAAGDAIVTQGEQGLGLYLIQSGRVEVVQSHDGSEKRLATLGPGEYFGEIALLTDQPRTATVRALEPTTCQVLTAWNFRAEVRQSPELASQLLKVVAERLTHSEQALLAR
ncbi:MAG TPA: cyclic nucleotide-binding domain-containing protein [Thermomicrobiales bacterium]|nr:cyclic nucleotide-binding domain-containing protein [Thermomicrobiales bacterium]